MYIVNATWIVLYIIAWLTWEELVRKKAAWLPNPFPPYTTLSQDAVKTFSISKHAKGEELSILMSRSFFPYL